MKNRPYIVKWESILWIDWFIIRRNIIMFAQCLTRISERDLRIDLLSWTSLKKQVGTTQNDSEYIFLLWSQFATSPPSNSSNCYCTDPHCPAFYSVIISNFSHWMDLTFHCLYSLSSSSSNHYQIFNKSKTHSSPHFGYYSKE